MGIQKPAIQGRERRTCISRMHHRFHSVKIRRGEYFVLGDHRNSSSDSGAWGTVDQKLIHGKAVFVYWPITKMGRL